jgi:hypothetical protein
MRQGYQDDPPTDGLSGERVFSSSVDLRYLLEEAPTRPDALIVAFSAAAHDGEAPRYYTLRALRAVPCHRLFVLDDRGPPGPPARPCWYVGSNRRTEVADSVCHLVREIAHELGVDRDRIITCGASKGGWAALYFAARIGAGHAIAAEPQSLLGQYLLQDGTYDIASHIAGGRSPADGEYLDSLLFEAFRSAEHRPHVHLYCGRGSPYYAWHVLPLIRCLESLGISVELELGEHSEHVPDLGRHFPGFLIARLRELLDLSGSSRASKPASAWS